MPVASIHLNFGRFSGWVIAGGRTYICQRSGLLGFVMTSEGADVAQVAHTPATRSWTVSAHERTFKVTSAWPLYSFDVLKNSTVVGRIALTGLTRRTVTADMPDSVPRVVRLLMVFTVLCIERQRRRATASSSG